MSDMRTAIAAVALALLLLFAGCASPQDETEEGGQPAEDVDETATDNDAGAEPVNPPAGANGTESNGTVNPTDTETGATG